MKKFLLVLIVMVVVMGTLDQSFAGIGFRKNGMTTVYHITKKSDWEKSGKAYTTDSLKTDKFIHCSTKSQVPIVANAFFKGQTDLVLLKINPSKLQSTLKMEDGTVQLDGLSKDEKFPHIYGPINKDAVEAVLDFTPDSSGKFQAPKE